MTIYQEKYGKNTVIFMEVGHFFEMYAIEDPETLIKITDLLGIQLTRKNKSKNEITHSNPYMAGVQKFTVKKFINVLLENLYTIILVEQVTPKPNIIRKVTQIISPGTFLNDTAVKSLIATGLIEGYENQDLITDVLKYYRNDYDFIIDQSEADEKLMFERLGYVLETFQIDSVLQNKRTEFGPIDMPYFSISEQVLSQLRDDEIYRGHLNNLIYIKISYNNFVKGTLEKNKHLQKLILEELNSFF